MDILSIDRSIVASFTRMNKLEKANRHIIPNIIKYIVQLKYILANIKFFLYFLNFKIRIAHTIFLFKYNPFFLFFFLLFLYYKYENYGDVHDMSIY